MIDNCNKCIIYIILTSLSLSISLSLYVYMYVYIYIYISSRRRSCSPGPSVSKSLHPKVLVPYSSTRTGESLPPYGSITRNLDPTLTNVIQITCKYMIIREVRPKPNDNLHRHRRRRGERQCPDGHDRAASRSGPRGHTQLDPTPSNHFNLGLLIKCNNLLNTHKF